MPLLRPPPALSQLSRISVPRRNMSSDHAHAHESPYDQPSGWFLNQDPSAPAKKEGWEGIMYWGFFGSLVVASIAYAYKPDTSIQTWALEEARRRLEVEGIVPDSTKKIAITEQLKTVSGK